MAFNGPTQSQGSPPIPVNQGDPVGGSCVGSFFPNPVVAPGAITNTQLAPNSVNSANIQVGSITANLFASGISVLPIVGAYQINSGVIVDANISYLAGIETVKLAEGLLFINNYASQTMSGVKVLQHGQTPYSPLVNFDLANKQYVDYAVISGISNSTGTISGSGTVGNLTKFTTASTEIGDSVLQESAGNIIINGQLLSNIGSISGNDIIANSILQGHLANNIISNSKLQSASVSGNIIATQSILTGMLTNNLISTANMQVGSVSGNVIGFGSILNGDIALNSINNNQLRSASVSGNVIATQSILTGMLTNNLISTANMQVGSVSGNVIAANSILTGMLTNNLISTSNLQVGSVSGNVIG